MEEPAMPSLETTFLGITYPNPFILASGPPTAKADMIIEAFKAGWGGAVTKTIGLKPTLPPSPRVHAMKSGKVKWGFLDIELISDMTVDQWCTEIDRIRDAFPDRPIIASIMGEGNPDSWQEVVQRLESHGVDAFEMNTSCPNFAAHEERGSKLGQDPNTLALAVRWVKEATELPVIVKLTPNVTDILPLAFASVEAGADAFCATNSLSGIGGIDLETFSPLPSVDGSGIVGGYGGPGLRPVALRITAELTQSTPIHVFGCGGISRWQDAVEYLALGASAVQLCTSVMWEGFQIIDKLTTGLERFLTKHHIDNLSNIIGKAIPESTNRS
jgi:dihydropyrimidine dehydrogenase (NAD+) subunit PreA